MGLWRMSRMNYARVTWTGSITPFPTYDNCTAKRTHPDADITTYEYDNSGNLLEKKTLGNIF